jgi:hypothetical protein
LRSAFLLGETGASSATAARSIREEDRDRCTWFGRAPHPHQNRAPPTAARRADRWRARNRRR